MNGQIIEREITNPKTLTAIFEVADKCKAIGKKDRKGMENFCITVVEEKMSKFGQKQREVKKSNSNRNKPIRTEILPEWFNEDEYKTIKRAEEQVEKDPKQAKREFEEKLNKLRA